MIWARIQFLPATSALAIDRNGGNLPWTITDYLLADLWEQQQNKGRKKSAKKITHPSRPQQPKKRVDAAQSAQRQKREAQHRRMLAQRKQLRRE